MLETLLEILSWDLPCPEIMLEEDGDLGLQWYDDDKNAFDVSINPTGGVNWAVQSPREHGTDIERLKAILTEAFEV